MGQAAKVAAAAALFCCHSLAAVVPAVCDVLQRAAVTGNPRFLLAARDQARDGLGQLVQRLAAAAAHSRSKLNAM